MIQSDAIEVGMLVKRDLGDRNTEEDAFKVWARQSVFEGELVHLKRVKDGKSATVALDTFCSHYVAVQREIHAEFDLGAIMGKTVAVVLGTGTMFGVVRGVHTTTLDIFGETIEVPVSITIDTDVVEISTIVRIEER